MLEITKSKCGKYFLQDLWSQRCKLSIIFAEEPNVVGELHWNMWSWIHPFQKLKLSKVLEELSSEKKTKLQKTQNNNQSDLYSVDELGNWIFETFQHLMLQSSKLFYAVNLKSMDYLQVYNGHGTPLPSMRWSWVCAAVLHTPQPGSTPPS